MNIFVRTPTTLILMILLYAIKFNYSQLSNNEFNHNELVIYTLDMLNTNNYYIEKLFEFDISDKFISKIALSFIFQYACGKSSLISVIVLSFVQVSHVYI